MPQYADIDEMIKGNSPMSRWMTNIDVQNLDHFEEWLASQAKQMLEMQLEQIKSGKIEDDLTTHLAAKGNAFLSALLTFRLARSRQNLLSPSAESVTHMEAIIKEADTLARWLEDDDCIKKVSTKTQLTRVQNLIALKDLT